MTGTTARRSVLVVACMLVGLTCCCWAWGPAPGFPNSQGRRPMHGWRSWQAYAINVNQSILEQAMEGLAKQRPVGPGGALMSLRDAGYIDVGLDAGYESHTGVNGSCHGPDRHMLVNHTLFPSLTAMNAKAHSLNLTSSWYLNSDACKGNLEPFVTYTEDANDAVKYGFDGVKFDSEAGGPNHNITLWATALNATGKQMMIENCLDKHPGYLLTDPSDCPFNFYRSGPDNAPDFLGGIAHVLFWAEDFLRVSINGVQASRPGCFAYPDMLGIGAPVRGTTAWENARSRGCANMTLDEERTLFANWAIVSSPLVLAFDVADDAVVEKYWPIVTHPTVLSINEAWAGEAGRLLANATSTFAGTEMIGAVCEENRPREFPNWAVYSKILHLAAENNNSSDGTALSNVVVAVLAINLRNDQPQTIEVSFDQLLQAATLPGGTAPKVLSFAATDVWTGQQLPGRVTPSKSWAFDNISPRNSSFVTFASSD